jgi:ketosteroid isomerase-like protein
MDLTSVKKRLLERDAEWAEFATEGSDVERILSYWTDDAVVIGPGMPAIVGKDALRQYVQDSLQIPGFRISWTTSDATLSKDGTLAYLFSQNSVTVNGPDGAPVTTQGRAVTIWRREGDGEWRCVVDIWNS